MSLVDQAQGHQAGSLASCVAVDVKAYCSLFETQDWRLISLVAEIPIGWLKSLGSIIGQVEPCNIVNKFKLNLNLNVLYSLSLLRIV